MVHKQGGAEDCILGRAIQGKSHSNDCFVAGTQILTSSGNVPIESLQEGDQVCTRLQPKQWGIRSSEVTENLAPRRIYGFNGEGAFFTASHVFHTMTGRRAIDPNAAEAEKPGQLKVGDKLLRAREDDTYGPVEIQSINEELVTGEYVYGVHLKEGLRSYHANGYLVYGA